MDKFKIDDDHTEEDYLYIDIPSRFGTVSIKIEDEGIVVDIFSMNVMDEPVASTYAHTQELIDG